MHRVLFLAAALTATAFADLTPSDGHLLVRKKELKWQAAPPSLPRGAQTVVLDGDPAQPGQFTMRLKVPANYKIAPHFHPVDEHVTVLEGTFLMGMGETFDVKGAHKMGPGDYARMTAGTKHFAMSKTAAVIQLHGVGPWGITYVNPSDDPRTEAEKK